MGRTSGLESRPCSFVNPPSNARPAGTSGWIPPSKRHVIDVYPIFDLSFILLNFWLLLTEYIVCFLNKLAEIFGYFGTLWVNFSFWFWSFSIAGLFSSFFKVKLFQINGSSATWLLFNFCSRFWNLERCMQVSIYSICWWLEEYFNNQSTRIDTKNFKLLLIMSQSTELYLLYHFGINILKRGCWM